MKAPWIYLTAPIGRRKGRNWTPRRRRRWRDWLGFLGSQMGGMEKPPRTYGSSLYSSEIGNGQIISLYAFSIKVITFDELSKL